MDLLSDLLHSSGLRRRRLNLQALQPGWAVRFPCPKSLGMHAVIRGQVFVHAPELSAPLHLLAGDVLVLARGSDHVLSLSASLPANDRDVVLCDVANSAPPYEPGSNSATQLVSGAYQFWNEPLHPFLRELPVWCLLRKDQLSALSPIQLSLGLLDAELRQEALGASAVTHGLMDVLFTYALRECSATLGQDQSSWHVAVRDPQLRRVLARMHEDCAHAWTLDELARDAGLSRTVLAERFRLTLGDTPLNHLRTLRMQKAMQLLVDTEHSLERVAGMVGYGDAFGFSKVFKRSTGLSPRQFRERDRADRDHPWRFQEPIKTG